MAASVDLIVVGSANVDRVVRVERRPAPGETVLGGDTALFPGGKGANTAVAAARQGVRTGFVGAVGDDDGGALLLASLAEAGVDTSTVRRVDGPSGTAHITVTPDGENAIVVSPGANARVSVADVRRAGDVVSAASVLFAVLEVPLETVCYAVAHASAHGVRVVLNASPVAELPAETLAALDPLIVNKHEAAVLLGGTGDELSGEELAAGLRDRGLRSVVVTLGAAGAIIADADAVVAVPAPELGDGRVVDTTGAGDAFAGALAAKLATGAPLPDAARHAVIYAAESVLRHGAQGT
ncbi:MAG: ribokinase [Actinophytocola sp.]|nr:ribokinase [Actinophytocola sp.]